MASGSQTVLAVGEGLNDMNMIEEADIGIQLSHPEVPYNFGDIIVKDI